MLYQAKVKALLLTKGWRHCANGQCVAEFCLLDSTRKLLLCLLTGLMSFLWLAKCSGKARIKKEVEINITATLMQLKQLPSHSSSKLWILALIK